MIRYITRWRATAAAIAVALAVVTPTAAVSAAPAGRSAAYVVRAADAPAAAAAVERAGGRVDLALDVIGGVAARLDGAALARLSREPGVSVAPDVPVRVNDHDFATSDPLSDPSTVTATPVAATAVPDVQLAALDLGPAWSPDAGAGVGIALIDTGVADVPGLSGANIVRGPDLSGEGDGIDRFGHGTFMAGLIVGQPGTDGSTGHAGVAPGATLVSVKVAGASGDTTLSRVIAGIGWVVVNEPDLHVRVMNLSLGADMPMAPEGNPLDAAVEAAWASGITVVASAGNEGIAHVTSPGDDPWVLTAGATDTNGTATTADDTVPSWSGRSSASDEGHGQKPDVLAPGVSLVSLRAPGSTIDVANPSARVGEDYFRGTGTSMSTALTTGSVALLAQDHPLATPDDLKGAISSSGITLPGSPGRTVDVAAADVAPAQHEWWQEHRIAFDGLGIGLDDRMPWTAARWSGDTWNAARWSAARWSAARWSAARWSAARWSAARWSAARWSAARWSDESFTGARWSASRWSASRWSAARWG